jgi:hypothetical protein
MRSPFFALISVLLLLSCAVPTPASAKTALAGDPALAQTAPNGAAKEKPAEQKAAEQKSAEQKQAEAAREVPTVDAGQGNCSASFTVLDANGKPVYLAKIHTLIRGLIHRNELTAQTNYYGKAQFIGLPNSSKKPIVFDVTGSNQIRSLSFDPGNRCKADFTVELK